MRQLEISFAPVGINFSKKCPCRCQISHGFRITSDTTTRRKSKFQRGVRSHLYQRTGCRRVWHSCTGGGRQSCAGLQRSYIATLTAGVSLKNGYEHRQRALIALARGYGDLLSICRKVIRQQLIVAMVAERRMQVWQPTARERFISGRSRR